MPSEMHVAVHAPPWSAQLVQAPLPPGGTYGIELPGTTKSKGYAPNRRGSRGAGERAGSRGRRGAHQV